MRLLAVLIGLIACTHLGAEVPSTNESDNPFPVPDYSDWYQVEIIVFALKNPAPSDEIWSEKQVWYPNEMLDLASEELKPYSLSQLKDLLDYEAMLGSEANSNSTSVPDSDFMFESRSRSNRNPLIEMQQSMPEDGGDTMIRVPDDVDLTAILDPGYPKAFEVVPDEERFLRRIAGSVNRSSRYRLLLYTGWRQPITATGDNWPVLIQAGERFDDRYEIDGTLTVSRARFLHVEADLWFTQFAKKYEQEMPLPPIVSEFDPGTLRVHKDLVEVERNRGNHIPIQSHQMRLSRRMRSATLHYLDDPYFGVLIQIENFVYETPEPTE